MLRFSIHDLVTLSISQNVLKNLEACNLILYLIVLVLPKLAGNISSIGVCLMKKQGNGLQSMHDI